MIYPNRPTTALDSRVIGLVSVVRPSFFFGESRYCTKLHYFWLASDLDRDPPLRRIRVVAK
jgi:hypothetical protein